MQIAIPLYDRFTALDAVGPYEVLARLPGAEVVWVAHEPGLVANDNGMLSMQATARFEDVPAPDVVVVPGGLGSRALLEDERLLGWLRSVHATSTWTTSVCTGSLLLAAAGILDGVPATTHWLAMDLLGQLGAVPTDERVVHQGKIVTAAGVSSGIDMGLWLAGQIAGDETACALQLTIEYDPQPPYDSGCVAKADPAMVARLRELSAASAAR
jgi:putative intracellular protease/amidase